MACGLFFGEQGPVVAERIDVEELEGGPHRVEGPLGDAQVIADVEDVVLDLPLAELIGRDHVVGGQLANSPQILAPGPFHQPGELQVTDHPLSEFGHGDTLWCAGTKSSGHSGRKLEGIKQSLRKVQTSARGTDSERSPIPRRSRFVQAIERCPGATGGMASPASLTSDVRAGNDPNTVVLESFATRHPGLAACHP